MNPPGPSANPNMVIWVSGELNMGNLKLSMISINLKNAREIGRYRQMLIREPVLCMYSYGFVYFLCISHSSTHSSILPFISVKKLYNEYEI